MGVSVERSDRGKGFAIITIHPWSEVPQRFKNVSCHGFWDSFRSKIFVKPCYDTDKNTIILLHEYFHAILNHRGWKNKKEYIHDENECWHALLSFLYKKRVIDLYKRIKERLIIFHKNDYYFDKTFCEKYKTEGS